MKGARKLLFGGIALAFLAGGFAASIVFPEGATVFGSYATAIVGVVAAVAAGNVGEHVAQSRATAALSREELDRRVAAALAAGRGGTA